MNGHSQVTFTSINNPICRKTMKDLDLAKFILSHYPDKDITPMKLQKLAFYAKAWTLVANHHFIDAVFEKWDFGPVNSNIYYKYKKYGSSIIPAPKSAKKKQNDHSTLLKFIISNYIDYSAFTLSAMTHNEAPWENTASNEPIPDELIISYYSQQPFAKNFTTLDENNKLFHILKSNVWHSFTLDMDSDEAATFATSPSYDIFSKQSDKAKSEFDQLIDDISDLVN